VLSVGRARTIRDVAKHAGVSVGTVSNAINQPDLLSAATLARVKKAIDDVGFVRNGAARQLRGTRSPAIALVIPDIENPFFTQLARGVEAAAAERNHLVILCNSGGDRSREDRHLRLLEEERVAGVLMTPSAERTSRLHQQIRERGTPIVRLDRRSSSREQCSITVDGVQGGRLAGGHLIELGHKQIAFVNGPSSITQFGDRRAGLVSALEEAGLNLKPAHEIEVDVLTIASGEAAATKLLQSRTPPTAIFCANDLMALGAEHAIIAAGHSVPGDIAIVGYDDISYAELALVPLTSVRQPAYELGHRAATVLLEEAAGGPHRHQHISFQPELIARQSTAR